MRFTLPANDLNLVDQFVQHVRDDDECIDIDSTLTFMPRKYRFAGYIGTLHYLMEEVRTLKEQVQELKKVKRGWFY